jgi:hypothetical protein
MKRVLNGLGEKKGCKIMASSFALILSACLVKIPDMPVNVSNVGIKNVAKKRTRRDCSVTLCQVLILAMAFVKNTS